MSLKARDLFFGFKPMNIPIYTPVKTEFAKLIYKVDFRGGDDCTPPRVSKKKIPRVN